VDAAVGDRVELAVELDVIVAPELLHQRDPLLEAWDALLKRNAHDFVLVRQVSEAEADVQAAAADDVERRHLLGEQHRVVER
jgi:hypothetical protein